MKRLLLGAMLLLTACHKTEDKICYECLVNVQQPDRYRYVGCYTKDEWEMTPITDSLGNALDKSQHCKKGTSSLSE